MKIRIIKVPDGQAPLEIREQWLGLEMSAERLSKDAIEIDFTKTEPLGLHPSFFSDQEHAKVFLDTFVPGANLGNRGGFVVEFDDAMQVLQKKSWAAVYWFEHNWGNGNMVFGPNEAEVIAD